MFTESKAESKKLASRANGGKMRIEGRRMVLICFKEAVVFNMLFFTELETDL